MATVWSYLSILKWKQGERIALRELTEIQWKPIVPLIELPAIDAAPDADSLRAALPAYVAKIAKDLKNSIPEAKSVAVDVRWVAPGYKKQARLLSVICKALQKASERSLIPVVNELMLSAGLSEFAALDVFDEVALRIRTSAVSAAQIGPLIAGVGKEGLSRNRMHLVLDQYTIVGANPTAQFAVIRPQLDAALTCGCASVTLAGGSFPVNLIGFKQGTYDISRVEWIIWDLLKKKSAYKPVCYGDYAVTNPGPLPDLDPTQINPSVAIRYAAMDFWRLYKAGGFKRGAPNQYRGLCKFLLSDSIYSGATFCYGDACYKKAAQGLLGNGNPSSWRRDATSHHLVFTVSQL